MHLLDIKYNEISNLLLTIYYLMTFKVGIKLIKNTKKFKF